MCGGGACPRRRGSSGAGARHLAYLVFGIGCVHDTSSFFSSINDNTYYSTCKNTRVDLTEILSRVSTEIILPN